MAARAPRGGRVNAARATSAMLAGVRTALLLATLLSGVSTEPRLVTAPPRGGIDMSELELQMSAGCDPAEEGCEVIEPLVTVEIREDVLEANVPRAPRAFDASVEKVSDAFFVWLTHPPESFWVNLAPTESDRVIEGELGRTDVGKTLLEADLLLKQTAARLLHPDHPLGARFWDQLYEWVGARGAKLCHSFRQWIVPGVAQLQLQRDPPDGATRDGTCDAHTGADMGAEASTSCASSPSPRALLHVLRAPLAVKQEAEFAAGGSGLAPIALDAEGATRELCRGADPSARAKADELFETIILPELERAVNEGPEYDVLRAIFAWRVVSEFYGAGGVPTDEEEVETRDPGDEEGGSADARRRARNRARLAEALGGIDATTWRRRASDGWTPEDVFDRYAASAMEGEFHVVRDVENARGDVLRRTYFHGGVDFRRVSFCARGESRAAQWCFDGGGSGARPGVGETGAVGLLAGSSEEREG